MAQVKTRVDAGANNVRMQVANDIVIAQYKIAQLATAGNGAPGVTAVLGGVLNRTGPAAAYTDTIPSAAALLAAAPTLTVGDSFSWIVRNTVAFAATLAGGTGIVIGTDTGIAASLVREYLLSVLATGVEGIYQVNTTNNSAVLTGFTATQIAAISPGMGVTGAGIPANATVIGVNSSTNTVTISANATATATVGATFFPRIQLDGVRSSTL